MREGALPAGLRLNASHRPGQAQPVPTRDVPARPWIGMALAALLTVVLMTGGWEAWARSQGLRPADMDDSPQAWAQLRRQAGTARVAIVGDSRILFDTDLDRFKALTGEYPLQLSIVGSTARGLLEDLANDPSFKGLLIVGLADTSYFRPSGLGYGGMYMHSSERNGKPSQRSGLFLDRLLQPHFAFLDSVYRFSKLAIRPDHGWRKGPDSPYEDVWKISETYPNRQYRMWPQIETNPYLQYQARHAWDYFKGPKISNHVIAAVDVHTREAVSRIRARGGEVVFVRPPSARPIRVNEDKALPRAIGWDRMLRFAHAVGVHNDDLPPQVQNLTIPEFSHLNAACATVFTDAYVRRLTQLTPRLKLRVDAPPPLTRADCVKAG
ncbi:MAG: hypothetical protein LC656_08690 [Sphingomonadales bacterium]|nr:hypothetical protein [Sphingomonadales bacterium]